MTKSRYAVGCYDLFVRRALYDYVLLSPPFGGLEIEILETRRLLRCAPGFMLSPPSGVQVRMVFVNRL